MSQSSLVEYIDRLRRWGGGTALAERRGYRIVRWSYRDVGETAAHFALELEGRGIRTGDRVLLWGPNSAEWVVAFWGCLLRGAVAVPLDQIATPDFASRVARQVDAKLLVCSREHVAFEPAVPVLSFEELPEVVRRPRLRVRVMHKRPGEQPEPAPPQFSSEPLGREHIAQIVFTSGTTAEPRGVVITHGNILANLEPLEAEIRKYLKYERFFHPLRFLCLLPLSHVFGQFLGIFLPPLLGATVIFQDTLNPSEVLRTIRRERVSVLVAVPRLLESLQEKIERDLEAEHRSAWLREQMHAAENEKFVRRMWRFRRIHRRFGWKFWAFISGGAALPPEVESFWMRLGFAVVQGYGLTETTSLVSVNHPFRLAKGSIGKVLPGREIKLDSSGEILVRGGSVSAGYWDGKDLKPVSGSAETEPGWFRTGDLGEIGPDGNLYFKGRRKNVIVTPAGMNVYPDDLEVALRRQPEVRDCVVVGLERDGNAEPCAVLILRAGGRDAGAAEASAEAPAETIVQRANQALAEYQHMRRWMIWPEADFPRTSTQKPRTNVIAAAVSARFAASPVARPEAGAGTPAEAPSGRSGIADLIARVTRRAPGGLGAEARLEADLNLSSLDRVALLGAIEDRYQIDLNELQFAAATTVADLECLLDQSAPRRSDYRYPRWAQRWPITWFRIVVYYLLAWPATWLLGSPRIRGRENLRGVRGPVLVIANHTLYLDPAFVLAALPVRFRHRLAIAMGGERLRAMRHPPAEMNFLLRWLYRLNYALVVALFNVFPLPQYSGFRESFQFAGESVDRGYSLLVFPEGELTPDGEIKEFRAGIGLLANQLNLPVVPVRIYGLFELKQRIKRNARFGQVRVTLGPPVRFPASADPERIARELESHIAALGQPSHAG